MEKEKIDGLSPSQRGLKGVLLWSWQYKEGIRPFSEAAQGNMSIEDFLHQMTDEELVHLLGGQPNTGVANTFGIGNMPEYGIPNVMTADGPAGLRIDPKCGIHTTAWPCATLLASTWNEELLYKTGLAGAREVKENNIGVWLAPAVNIHRSPLCGRNFEYYSEDPLLTGKMAAAFVRGVQSQHIGATVKHFALNNKETNRKNSDSRVSERAAREIYLKAFEIIVKEAKPWCIMTSYNIINGHRSSENEELLSGILRGEWGFEGMVTTDWWTFGEHYKEAAAGNDLKMAAGAPERLLEAKKAGAISRESLEQCAARILEMILKLD
jgi:beta-glucosidase